MLRFLGAFFTTAPTVTRPIAAALWTMTVAGTATMSVGWLPGEAVLTPLLVLQIFAASSGLGLALRRGCYDLVLARGVPLWGLLAAHWLASAAPGIGAWMVVAVAERLLSPFPAAALTSGSVLALGLASTLPWAITIPLPRFAAAIGWLVLLVSSLAAAPSGQLALMSALHAPSPSVLGALAVVAYPMGLIGFSAAQLPLGTAAPGAVAAAVSCLGALVGHRRVNVPLETAT